MNRFSSVGTFMVHIVAENSKGKGLNNIVGLFHKGEEAEQLIRDRGEILWWKEDYFKPFARIWSLVLASHEGKPLRCCFWSDRRAIDLSSDWESLAHFGAQPHARTFVLWQRNRYTMGKFHHWILSVIRLCRKEDARSG